VNKSEALRHELEKAGVTLRENEPLRDYTSFRIGGPARLMAFPGDAKALETCLRLAREAKMPALVLGNGTNVLAPDEGLEALVVLTRDLNAVEIDGTAVTADAGALLSRTAVAARDAGLAGMEFAHGIPGSIGGAVCMNAGAYGGEMKDIVRWAEVLDEDLRLRRLDREELDLGYRHSMFSDRPGAVLRVGLQLIPGERETIRTRMEELSARRRASQPLEKPSAGSAFKRPKTGYAAALIDEAGLKGLRVGGAEVSTKHAGFVVNVGGATAEDVKKLMALVKERVLAASGVELEAEVKIL